MTCKYMKLPVMPSTYSSMKARFYHDQHHYDLSLGQAL